MKKRILKVLFTTALVMGMMASTVLAAPETTVPNPTGGINEILTEAVGDAANDNDVLNANGTGNNVGTNDGTTRNDVIKSTNEVTDETQRTHGEYQNNTNSCASCHQTHTAAGDTLLFKSSVYTTCTACHDGTLGFYNVFEGSTAGSFGGEADMSSSVHLATGSVANSAAPGGNQAGTGEWTSELNCATCHAPHGSYSDRLLNYNPNGMGTIAPSAGGIKAGGTGQVGNLEKILVYNFSAGAVGSTSAAFTIVTTDPTTRFIAVRGTKFDHGVVDEAIGDTDDVMMIYERVGTKTTDKVYKKSTTAWLYGYGARNGSADATAVPPVNKTSQSNYARFFTVDPSTLTIDSSNRTLDSDKAKVIDYGDEDLGVVIEFGKALAYSNATTGLLKDALYAEVGRAYVVKMDLIKTGNYGGVPIYTVNEGAFSNGLTMGTAGDTTSTFKGVKTTGLGIAMSSFCAACHVDYMAAKVPADQVNAEGTSGIFEEGVYRHTTTSDSYTCVRCHFAHGTEVNIMKDAKEQTVATLQNVQDPNAAVGTNYTVAAAQAYLMDSNPSSALKRYTNMSVCWACHTSSHAESLKNNNYFMNENPNAPHGLIDNTPLPTAPVEIDYPN